MENQAMQTISGGNFKYLRVAALKKGDVIEGIYLGSAEGTYGLEHKIEATNSGTHKYTKQDGTKIDNSWQPGDMLVINNAASFEKNLPKCEVGTSIRIAYNGRAEKSKKYPNGKPPHSFEIKGTLKVGGVPAAAKPAPAPAGDSSGRPF